MKNRFLVIIIQVLVAAGACAKDYLHTPVVGEYDKKQAAYFSLKDTENSLFWNLSRIQVLDKVFHVTNELSVHDENIIIGTEHDTRYSYQRQKDSLLLWGYENHTSTTRYNIPEVIFRENLGIGEHTTGFFHGVEMYCGKLPFRIFGAYDLSVAGKGTLILPTGDSLCNVTLIHYAKTVSKVKYPKVKSLEELENYVFYENPYNKDSIICNQKNDAVIFVHQYKWYAEGYRYPVYETISTSIKEKENLYKTAYYFPPEEQEKLYDEPNENLRAQLSSSGYAKMGSKNNKNVEAGKIYVSGQIEFSNKVSITIDSPVSAKADLAIYTSNGILIDKKNDLAISKGKSHHIFNISPCRSDVFIVTCNVNGNIFSKKIEQ